MSPRSRRRLEALAGLGPNFDPALPDGLDQAAGWRSDDRAQALPPEPPGPPVPGGSFEVAARLSRDYAFADPKIVRAVFDPETPLEDRNMLLELGVLGLALRGGVRVGLVVDEEQSRDGRPARVFAWNYFTLEGHPEAGRRDYEVWKYLDTGEVEFRTHAFSRSASGHRLVRLGFRLIGRPLQVAFVDRACARMAALTAAELAR